jgi:hypothetical protein
MRHTVLSILILLFLSSDLNAGDDFCGLRNTTFVTGETMTFKVYYALGFYVAAGEAVFRVNLERMNNKPVYHITADGKTFSFYDSFFKVRDKYESFIDTATLQPLKFIRNIYEGGYKKYENVTFNQANNTAVSTEGTVRVPNCIQDVISSLYYARNIDFSKYKVNDKIPFSMYIGNEVFNLYIRYLGKETVKTKKGKFNAIKFKPLLLKGDVFEGGEKMVVWVSDGGNHIPLRVESPISVGSIKVDMMECRNLRYPLSSLISTR